MGSAGDWQALKLSMKILTSRFLFSFLILLACRQECSNLALAKNCSITQNKAYSSVPTSSIVIKSPPEKVFEGIQNSRLKEPERRKLIAHSKGIATIEETLLDCPVIGTAKVVYKEHELPFQRIDFALENSDKLKSFQGSWELHPLDSGKATEVKLSTYTEAKIWVPFSREITARSTLKDIHRRLQNLKNWIENSHESNR